MDVSTILFACSVIGCIIGILGFASSRNAKAQKDGILEEKLNTAINGIDEIKKDMKCFQGNQSSQALLVQSHDEQIKTLYRLVGDVERRVNSTDSTSQALVEILNILKEQR